MKKSLFITFINLIILSLILIGGCAQAQIYSALEWEEKQQKEELEYALNNAISWTEAKYHIGERLTVSGPVVSAKHDKNSKNEPTFINIGKAYPEPGRFTVIIWGYNRQKFTVAPEKYYLGKIIYVEGLIAEFNGEPEIEVEDPSQIKE